MNLKNLLVASGVASAMVLSMTPMVYARTGVGAQMMNRPMRVRAMGASFRGTVVGVNGTTLTVNKNGTTVSVDASSAKFIRRFGGASSVSELSVNDVVAVTGKWTDSTKTAVTATVVRDVSIQKRRDLFTGIVSSVTGTGFVVNTPKRGSQTVVVSDTTKYAGRRGTTVSLSTIQVGDRVTVRGMWDRTSNTITADMVRDLGAPKAKTSTTAAAGVQK